MATITAQILVGSGHPNHDGIWPGHCLYLSENSRPTWILVPDALSSEERAKVTWIPTVESMLEDALLMIAIHVIKAPPIVELAQEYIQSQEQNWVVMYEDVEPENRRRLYQRCRELENNFKLVITVLRGSAIEEQLPVLTEYQMDVEVCTPSFVRLYSRWLEQTRVEGEL
ncbi:MAG: hypothetical protein FH749_09480 [Firmicutes bacterium]|nr:hypothetical protein [Bacillota bacterium]